MGKSEEETISEAQALADILTWSMGCRMWQRDALWRLCIKSTLDDNDLDELTALCKQNGRGSIVLAPEHIPLPQAAMTAVNLRAIQIVENINALKPGERLTFDRVGMTVVYGDNGSGESGYSRS